MSENFIVNSNVLIEILSGGCENMECEDCPFFKMEYTEYCEKVKVVHTDHEHFGNL